MSEQFNDLDDSIQYGAIYAVVYAAGQKMLDGGTEDEINAAGDEAGRAYLEAAGVSA